MGDRDDRQRWMIMMGDRVGRLKWEIDMGGRHGRERGDKERERERKER